MYLSRHWVAVFSGLFIVALCASLLLESYVLLALPVVLLIAWIGFFKTEWLIYIVAFATPFSINIEELGIGGISLYAPTEPLLFGMLGLILLGQLYRKIIDAHIWRHPVSLAIVALLIWTFITSFTGVNPVVSLKYLVARLWFIVPIYFFGATVFLQKGGNEKFIHAFLIALFGVVLITTIKHAANGFDEASAHWIMQPFFRDHTQYAATIAIFIPLAFGLMLDRTRPALVRTLYLGILILLCIALVYTYSRAAWVSVIAAMGLWGLARLKIKLGAVVMVAVAALIYLIASFDSLVLEMRKNQTDSSDSFVENVESITNISTDASNLERLNRWNAVFAMAREKPSFGFGPGNYMFEYAPYQSSNDLTIISTNFGDVGNAHSEYLGPLAEMGIPGMLLTIYFVWMLFYSAYRTYHRLPPGRERDVLLLCTLGLVTYFTHGLLNNFLDADKASVPVFGLIAIIVACDVKSRSEAIKS